MSKRRSRSLTYEETSENPLCLCEYYNKNNERVHLLMCCCNCEAMDTLCTSLFCCHCRQTSTNCLTQINDAINDVFDRLRYPFFGGARKINIDFALSLLTILFYLYIGTLNFPCSILTIIFVPLILYTRFFSLRVSATKPTTTTLKDLTTQKKPAILNRIQIAHFIILNSLISILIVFNQSLHEELSSIITPNEKNRYSVFLLLAILLHIWLNKSNPGLMKKIHSEQNKVAEETSSKPVVGVKNVCKDENFCDKCNLRRGQGCNVGHCPVCQSCVFNRDHHCFWIDNCVGYLNHKLFLAYVVYLYLFFVYSFYLIWQRLRQFECGLFVFGKGSDGVRSCLFDVYYSNQNRALLTIFFVQLIPLLGYLTILLVQQFLFVSLGLTQYQLFKLSQRNIRFSLALFIAESLTMRSLIKNWLQFFKFRTKKDLVNKQSIVQDYLV